MTNCAFPREKAQGEIEKEIESQKEKHKERESWKLDFRDPEIAYKNDAVGGISTGCVRINVACSIVLRNFANAPYISAPDYPAAIPRRPAR